MKLVALLLLLIQVTVPAPIDVNTATRAELVAIEGITPTVADHIIRDRPYKTVEDVQGVVPRFLFERIRTRITVTSSPVTSSPSSHRNAVTPIPGNPQPQRKAIQVIQGNRVENLPFWKEPEVTAPVIKPAPEKEAGATLPSPQDSNSRQ